MIIFGIDPGTATTGYGVLTTNNSDSRILFNLVDYGCIVTPKDMEMPMRLLSIQKHLDSLLRQYKPDCVSIEQLFFGVNSRTAMTVGQARGVVLLTAANYRLPIYEYQGLHVKATITGSGKADKKEIQKWVAKHLGKRKITQPFRNWGDKSTWGDMKGKGFLDDAVDALAVAMCHWFKVTNGENTLKTLRAKKVKQSRKKAK